MARKRRSKFEDCLSILNDPELCYQLAAEQSKRLALSPHKSDVMDLIEKSSAGCGCGAMTSGEVAAASLPKPSEVDKANVYRNNEQPKITRLGECLIDALERGMTVEQAIEHCKRDDMREYKEPKIGNDLKPLTSDEAARLSLPKRQRLE